jgi:hypothetical protein
MTRFLLAAIALGLWANIVIRPAHAGSDCGAAVMALDSIASNLGRIASAIGQHH